MKLGDKNDGRSAYIEQLDKEDLYIYIYIYIYIKA